MEKRFPLFTRLTKKKWPELIIIKIRGGREEKPKRNNLRCTDNNDYSINFFKFIHNFLGQTKTKLLYVTAVFGRCFKRSVILLFDRNRSKRIERSFVYVKCSHRIIHARIIHKLKFGSIAAFSPWSFTFSGHLSNRTVKTSDQPRNDLHVLLCFVPARGIDSFYLICSSFNIYYLKQQL